VRLRSFIRELADCVPVAICSGNHDNAGRLVSHDRASVYEWFIELGTHPNIITDGSTRKLENLIVTTIPYHCSKEEKSIWLNRGSTIRRQTGIPWIFLHHVPAKTGLAVSGEELEASELLAAILAIFPPRVGGKRHAYRNANQNPQSEIVYYDAKRQAQRNSDSYRLLLVRRVYVHAFQATITREIGLGREAGNGGDRRQIQKESSASNNIQMRQTAAILLLFRHYCSHLALALYYHPKNPLITGPEFWVLEI